MRRHLLVLASAMAVALATQDLVGSDEAATMELLPEEIEVARTAQSQGSAENLGRGATYGHHKMAAGSSPYPYKKDQYKEAPYKENPYKLKPYQEDSYKKDQKKPHRKIYHQDPYYPQPQPSYPHTYPQRYPHTLADPYQKAPYHEDPYKKEPYHEDPYKKEPYHEDSYKQDPYHEEPYKQDPYHEDPYKQDPYHEDPYKKEPYQEDSYKEDDYHNPNEILHDLVSIHELKAVITELFDSHLAKHLKHECPHAPYVEPIPDYKPPATCEPSQWNKCTCKSPAEFSADGRGNCNLGAIKSETKVWCYVEDKLGDPSHICPDSTPSNSKPGYYWSRYACIT